MFCSQLDPACDFLTLRGVYKCGNCQPLGLLNMFTVSHPKESELYAAPRLVTAGLVPSDKLLVCCEVGKNFASDLVLLLLCEKLDSAAEIGLV